MSNERRSTDTSTEQKAAYPGARNPWILPETGVHITTLNADDLGETLAAILDAAGAGPETGPILVDEHDRAVTSFDDTTVRAGCGCGWAADDLHPLTGQGRAAAADDLRAHLVAAAVDIAWVGTSRR